MICCSWLQKIKQAKIQNVMASPDKKNNNIFSFQKNNYLLKQVEN